MESDVAHGRPDAEGARVRKVVHVDMDAFFASVEQRDDPSLRGRPVAVGGSRERGVVAAASYEARRFGVRSAMPSLTARRLCPELVFVKPRFEVYREVSGAIREIFLSHTPLVEPLSLDEAYLDVTENLRGLPTATAVAKAVRAEIREATDLTASAGVSYNKFLAKMASGERKPDGLFVILPEAGPDYVAALPVARFHGVGDATARRMHALGIVTGADLRERSLAFLAEHFGKAGRHFHAICRGIDERPVVPDRVRKSSGAETTFDADVADIRELRSRLPPLVDKAWERCARGSGGGRHVTLKVKYSDFEQITRARSLPANVSGRDELESVAAELLARLAPLPKPVRLIGVSIGLDDGTREPPAQMDLGL